MTDSFGDWDENLSAGNSHIKDVDVAEEITGFGRNNILFRRGPAMLSKANMLPLKALRLIG